MDQDKRKYVDESWKETAQKQKEQLKNVNIHKQPLQKEKAFEPPSEHVEEHLQEVHEPEPSAPEQSTPEPSEEEFHSVEINFLNYITSLAFQAMVFLGEIPHPATNQLEKNLAQAKMLIDTLVMLREKTKKNLDVKEESMLNATVYELQMKYVEISQKEAANP